MIALPRNAFPQGSQGKASWQTVVLILGFVAAVFGAYQLYKMTTSGRVDYPYWCKDCQAVFSRSELGKDPEKWKTPPGSRSDSVVYCLRCKTGSAHPAVPCPDCGTVHVLHLWKDNDCPKCHPEIAQAAAEKGIDLTPKKLQ